MHKPLSKPHIKKLNQDLVDKVNSTHEIVFLLQDVMDPINVGSIFRTADGCNASLILTGRTAKPRNPQISLAARGLERSVAWEYYPDVETIIPELKNDGFEIIGLELSDDSILYSDYQYPSKVCLVLGNEGDGVYKKVLNLCDKVVALPMMGKGPSLNVNVATAVVGYTIRQQALV